MSESFWTEERIKILRKQWWAGNSTREIATFLGNGLHEMLSSEKPTA